MKWHVTQDLLLKLAGSTTIPDLNHDDFYSVKIGLPSVEEQCQIISQIDSHNNVLRDITLKLNALKSLKKISHAGSSDGQSQSDGKLICLMMN